MRFAELGTSLPAITLNTHAPPFCLSPSSFPPRPETNLKPSHFTNLGLRRACQIAADTVPTVYPDIVVREAKLEDFWEVAETHCTSFFPGYSFPMDFLLRLNRVVGLLAGFTLPEGCRRICLVAVGSTGFGYVAGILTVDTVADFLPRKGPLAQRRYDFFAFVRSDCIHVECRTGIAYVSNVAVREVHRRKGIGKRLVTAAEATARRWNCRSIALHCDSRDPIATRLYTKQGYKCIKVPEGANWPQPRSSPECKFQFMMKLL